MFKRSVLLSLCLLLSQHIMAAIPPKPARCPDVNTVKSEGLHMAQILFGDSTYAVINFSNYGLKEKWGFVILPVEANNELEAIQNGRKVLTQVSGSPMPMLSDDKTSWDCYYQAPNNYFAIAVTPLPDMPSFIRSVHRFTR